MYIATETLIVILAIVGALLYWERSAPRDEPPTTGAALLLLAVAMGAGRQWFPNIWALLACGSLALLALMVLVYRHARIAAVVVIGVSALAWTQLTHPWAQLVCFVVALGAGLLLVAWYALSTPHAHTEQPTTPSAVSQPPVWGPGTPWATEAQYRAAVQAVMQAKAQRLASRELVEYDEYLADIRAQIAAQNRR